MNKLLFKYILLAIFAIITIFGVHPTLPLLKSYIVVAVVPIVLLFFLRQDLVDLVLLWFVLLLFKEFGALPLPMLPDIFPYRLVWVLIFGIYLFDLILKKRERILPVTGLEVAMILFTILCLSSMLLAGTLYSREKGLTLSFFLNGYGFPFSIFFISKNVVDNEKQIKKVFIFFTLLVLYLGLTGIFEHFQMRQFVFPHYIMRSWEGGTWGRARGPFMNSSVNGTAIGMMIFMVICLLLRERLRWKRGLLVIVLLTSLVTLLFTLTRASWLAFLVAILMTSIFISSVRKIVIPGFLFLIVFVVIIFYSGLVTRVEQEVETKQVGVESPIIARIIKRTSNVKTVTGRWDLLKLSFLMFIERPIFGYGYGTFHDAKDKFLSRSSTLNVSEDLFIERRAGGHATLMGILVDLGVVGFIIILYMIWYIARVCKKLYDRLPQGPFIGKELIAILIAIMIVYLINVQMIEVRFFIFPNSLFFFVVGIVVGLEQRILRQDKITGPLEIEEACE
jgi:O-antigen ligase